MLRLTSHKTFRILYYILTKPNFTQVELNKRLDISLGLINKVIKWGISKGLIIKAKGLYSLIAPNKLIDMIASQYTIEHSRVFFVDFDKNKLIKRFRPLLRLCLFSALESFDKEFKSNEVHTYYSEELINELNKINRGDTKVTIYEQPYSIVLKGNKTDLIQTILDMHSINQEHLTKDLRFKQWQTMQ
jgi:hypothetical protein